MKWKITNGNHTASVIEKVTSKILYHERFVTLKNCRSEVNLRELSKICSGMFSSSTNDLLLLKVKGLKEVNLKQGSFRGQHSVAEAF